MNNKVITSQGNVQFIFPDGKIVNVHPNHIYTVFNEDTVSFILVALPKSSGLALMTSKAEDLELNGETYSFAELPAAMSEAFAIAGAQARCEIVDELPETGYTNTIYLVPQPAPQTGFDEYVYVDGEWELIGDTSIEMENYVTKTVFSGYTASTAAELSGKAEVVEITQANYDLLPSSAKTDASKLYVISDAQPIDLSIYAKVSALTEEISARSAADSVISGVVDTLSTALANEVQRAQNAESGLSEDIEDEMARAMVIEDALQDAIDAVSGDVISETSRAEAAEDALDDKIDAVSAATDDVLALKQDVLEAGENITISGNVISAEGGGKAIEGGRGISVTTGETADTISFNLPISANTNSNGITLNDTKNQASGSGSFAGGTTSSILYNRATKEAAFAFGKNCHADGSYSQAFGNLTKATASSSHAEGDGTDANGTASHAEGYETNAKGNFSHAEGYSTHANGEASHAEGYQTTANNRGEHATGYLNKSTSASTTFGDSGNTLFSVGNGYHNGSTVIGHNSIEIKQNGDIYIADVNDTSTSNYWEKPMIKLQDQLGGGGGEVSTAITSGDTNAVAGGAVFDAVVYSGNTYTTELTFDADGYAENWVVGTSAITIDVSGYTSDTSADYHFEDSNGLDLGRAYISKVIGSWGGQWSNNADNCTITTDGDTATTATITDIPSGTVKIRRRGEINPPKAIISGDTPEIWIKDALDDHRDNTTIHITNAERSSWNNKSNFSGSYNDLTDKPIPDSALTSYSTNAVQSKTLYDELRISNGGETETTLRFEMGGIDSINYPEGCTKIKVEVIGSMNESRIYFFNDGQDLGEIEILNNDNISVYNNFQGATYEISGTTVIISYPTITNVTKIQVNTYDSNYIYKAVTTEPPTAVKDQVAANTTALGGLKLQQISQSDYDNLPTKDSSTLYIII